MSKFVSLLEKGKPPWEKCVVNWVTDDGAYSMVEVTTQWDFELEGYYLAHCLGTKNADEFNVAHRVFSLRDRLGFPHATILLQRIGRFSPYGQSRDLLTDSPVLLKEEGSKFPVRYNVLQVRGREDQIARWEYYALVRDWYTQHGGVFRKSKNRSLDLVRRAVVHAQDKDIKYHYGYLLDESVNFFTWSYSNTDTAERLAELGLVNL